MLAKQLFDFLNVKSCCDILTIYFCPEQTDTPFKLITRLQSLEDVIIWHKATFFKISSRYHEVIPKFETILFTLVNYCHVVEALVPLSVTYSTVNVK